MSSKNLVSVTVPEGVTVLWEGAFKDCPKLTEVILPDSIEVLSGKAFQGCVNLTNIKLSANLTEIGNEAFSGCRSLADITLPESVISIGNQAFEACGNLANVRLSPSLAAIGDGAFRECDSLRAIALPSSVVTLGESAFYGCVTLTEISLHEGLQRIGRSAFEGCTSLTGISLPKSVDTLGERAFYGCQELTNVTLSGGLTAIEDAVFYDCAALPGIKIPETVTAIGNSAFEGCTSLTRISLPKSVNTLGERAFYGCQELTDITLSGGLTAIEDAVFYGCAALPDIKIPDSVAAIGNSAFEGCASLADISLPENVTTLGKSAFAGCQTLKEIILPQRINSIGTRAFANCNGLESVILPNDNVSFGQDIFAGVVPSRVRAPSLPQGVFSETVTTFELVCTLEDGTIVFDRPFTARDGNLSEGNYYLTAPTAELSGAIRVPKGTVVRLNLRGGTLDGADVIVSDGATLLLCNGTLFSSTLSTEHEADRDYYEIRNRGTLIVDNAQVKTKIYNMEGGTVTLRNHAIAGERVVGTVKSVGDFGSKIVQALRDTVTDTSKLRFSGILNADGTVIARASDINTLYNSGTVRLENCRNLKTENVCGGEIEITACVSYRITNDTSSDVTFTDGICRDVLNRGQMHFCGNFESFENQGRAEIGGTQIAPGLSSETRYDNPTLKSDGFTAFFGRDSRNWKRVDLLSGRFVGHRFKNPESVYTGNRISFYAETTEIGRILVEGCRPGSFLARLPTGVFPEERKSETAGLVDLTVTQE